jgi:hypothetical protein
MWASSNGAQVHARGWSYGAGRPRAAEGSAWQSQLATAAPRASFPVASSDDAQARVRGRSCGDGAGLAVAARTRHGRARMALRHGKAEAIAGPATGGRKVTMLGDDVQSGDVRGGDRMRQARRSHARRAPFIHTEVRAEATRRGFDAQRKTGGGGRPALMASQQVERVAELQNPEVRAELNRRIREFERKCFTSGRLGSFPQV